MAIPNSLTAENLFHYTEDILWGLAACNIWVVSYVCDGTETERQVQRLLVSRADRTLQTVISNDEGYPALKLSIPVLNEQPIVMIQDSKHALKTFRNNLFSGARLLTLGNFVALHQTIRDIAFEDRSPLYRRDVEKLDRQDDHTVTRLFSAATLEYMTSNHPSRVGEIVYLFVFGELVDAYQNRRIPHADRIRMALRANYILDLWEIYLQQTGYSQSQYFLSREAADIARILVQGLLSLIVVHRDCGLTCFPLLPWLHSSEACKHIFVSARMIIKDFTLLDFMYMQPKINTKVRADVLWAQSSDPRARASGYNHTYFNHDGISLVSLATYPSDPEMNRIATQAAQEAGSLAALLGLAADCVLRPRQSITVQLPGIDSWYHDEDNSEIEGEDYESDNEAQELQDLVLQLEKDMESLSRDDQEALSSLTCASIGLSTNDAFVAYVPLLRGSKTTKVLISC
jgi:hypothetical protein